MSISATARRTCRDPGKILWALTGAGWMVIVALEFVPDGHLAHPAHAAGGLGNGVAALPLTLAAFTGGWLVMVTAMMLPTTVPMARMFTTVSARQESTGPVRSVFFGAYFVIWLAFGVAGLAGATALQYLARGVRPDLLLAGAFALAGAFQFSSLKQRCLAVCRNPGAFLFAHYRRGTGGAWEVGVRHALACLGCCWALMLVMFATGVADLAWMLGLTAVMVVEKVTRWGHRITAPVGIALLTAAVLLTVTGIGPPVSDMHTHIH